MPRPENIQGILVSNYRDGGADSDDDSDDDDDDDSGIGDDDDGDDDNGIGDDDDDSDDDDDDDDGDDDDNDNDDDDDDCHCSVHYFEKFTVLHAIYSHLLFLHLCDVMQGSYCSEQRSCNCTLSTEAVAKKRLF